jgi:hypothetical protein
MRKINAIKLRKLNNESPSTPPTRPPRRTCLAYFLIAVVTYLLTTTSRYSTAQGLFNLPLRSNQEQPASVPSRPGSDNREKISFKLIRISDGRSDDGTWWKTFNLVASDGNTLYKQDFPFTSVRRADKQFQLYLNGAIEVIRRKPELDQKGNTVGERVLARFARNEAGRPHYTLFWTRQALFQQVTGENLDDILALESRLRELSLTSILREDSKADSPTDGKP